MPQQQCIPADPPTRGKPLRKRKPTDRLTGGSFTFIFYRSHIGTMSPTETARFGRDGL